MYLQFRVELRHASPAIWRQFLLRPEAAFAELHEAIQAGCGWTKSHLYCFFYPESVGLDPIAGCPGEDDPHVPDAGRMPLDAHFGVHRSCLYLYDFGDGWEHDVSFEGSRNSPRSWGGSLSTARARSRPRTAAASAGTRTARL